MQNPPKSVWLSVARRHGEAWRGVTRRGEARRGEAWLGRRGGDFGPRCVEGGGVYPTLKGGTALKTPPLTFLGILDRLGGVLGHLGPSWQPLGALLGRLGGLLAPLGGQNSIFLRL